MKTSRILLLAVAISALSCQPQSKESKANDAFNNIRDAFFLKLVNPREAAAQLQATGAPFNPALLSDPEKFSDYIGSDTKAATNLGIYLADLNYCIAYKQSDDNRKYFNAVLQLSKIIGIEKKVLEFLGIRYQENINQNDSLKTYFYKLYDATTRDLKNSDHERLVGIVMAAYSIENLNLALGIIKTYPKDILPDDSRMLILTPLFQYVFDQRDYIINIYNFLKAAGNPDNPHYLFYTNAFTKLITTYDQLGIRDRIRKNQGADLLKNEAVAALSEKVGRIRAKAVSAE